MSTMMINGLMEALVGWLAETVNDLLGGLLAFLTSSIFVSPDVTVLPHVRSIAGNSALVVSACFVLAVIAAGIAVMLGDSVETQYHVKQLVPRLVVGFVLSAFAVPLTGVLIRVANALTVAMAGESAPTIEAIAFIRARVASAMTDPSNALLIAVIGLLIVVLMFMLVGTWLVRIGMLVILAGIAPVALACYATPWTQGAATLWWRTLLGCLATPTLQAVAFSAGINLLVDPESNLPILLGLRGSDTLNLLMVIVVLWTTVKIPNLMRRFVTQQGRAPNITGLILRTVAVQGMTRGLGGRTPTPVRPTRST
ncbi:conjugal transfer protein TrbL family protein [Micromonospora sp. CP22]|uniref:conjugal transfer protein TrbL family protein n=1 Tax=Micromonospora sp. CP22 TaxID=2580517 RepID=UPI001E40CE8B|nr:conjugal transfer protein TrbL family protein [Micromonospora sp. CP22]